MKTKSVHERAVALGKWPTGGASPRTSVMRPGRARAGVLIVIACLLMGACLGSDYKSVQLALSPWDHGWQATIEPGEIFDVNVWGNRLHSDARWRVVEFDQAVIALVAQGQQGPDAEEPDRGTVWRFDFRGVDPGESVVELEAVVGGKRVDRLVYTVVVVGDACAVGLGVTAPRCRDPMPDHGWRGWTEADDGRGVRIGLDGPTMSVSLTSHAMYPDAEWRVASVDSSLLAVGRPTPTDVRTAGDFGNGDTSKPDSFLRIWEFPVDGVALGTSELTFEVVSGGEQVDVAAFAVKVQESVEEGDYLIR